LVLRTRSMSSRARWIISVVGPVVAFVVGVGWSALNYRNGIRALQQKDTELAQRANELEAAHARWNLEKERLEEAIKNLRSQSDQLKAQEPVKKAWQKELADVGAKLTKTRNTITSSGCYRGWIYSLPRGQQKYRAIV